MYLKRFLWIVCLVAIGTSLFLVYPTTRLGSYTYIPISFCSKEPVVQITIDKTPYRCILDLGSSKALSLQKKVLDQFEQKQFVKQDISIDFKGLAHPISCFRLPAMNLCGIEFKELLIAEENPSLLASAGSLVTSLHPGNQKEPIDGRLGWPIFKDYCCLFDFSHGSLFLSKDPSVLRPERSMPTSQVVRAPFEMTEYGILVSVTTDFGIKKMVLDTGSFVSALKETSPDQRFFFSSQFLLGDHDFGNSLFMAHPLFKEIAEIDGILGLPFFIKHTIYIDFQNHWLYISH